MTMAATATVKYKQKKATARTTTITKIVRYSGIASNSSPSANDRWITLHTLFMYALRATECHVNETELLLKKKIRSEVKLQLSMCVRALGITTGSVSIFSLAPSCSLASAFVSFYNLTNFCSSFRFCDRVANSSTT